MCTTALETGLTGTFRLTVRKDLKFDWPFAENEQHLMSIGLDEDLVWHVVGGHEAGISRIRVAIRLRCICDVPPMTLCARA